MHNLFSKRKFKRKISYPDYKTNSVIRSFFRFIKNQSELKKLVVIPLCIIILILLTIILFIAPSNSLIENLFTTFIGILIVITFISFIQYRENQKRFFSVYHKIIEEIVNGVHTFIRALFEDFLAPSPSDNYNEYLKIDNEPYCVIFSYKNYLRKSNQFLELAKKIAIERIEKKEEIRSATLYKDAKNDLMNGLLTIKKEYISILDLMVLNAMGNFKSYEFENEKPFTDDMHSGIWGRDLIMDIKSTLENCFTLLEAVKQWDKDLDRTFL